LSLNQVSQEAKRKNSVSVNIHIV